MSWPWRFGRAGDAVTGAVAAHRALLAELWPTGLELRARMSLHTGETDECDGDYLEPPLNRGVRSQPCCVRVRTLRHGSR
jgi:hypothetical protein